MERHDQKIIDDLLNRKGFEGAAAYALAFTNKDLGVEYAGYTALELYKYILTELAAKISSRTQTDIQVTQNAIQFISSLLEGEITDFYVAPRIPKIQRAHFRATRPEEEEILPGEHTGVVITMVSKVDGEYWILRSNIWGGLRIPVEYDTRDIKGLTGHKERDQYGHGHEHRTERLMEKATHFNFFVKPNIEDVKGPPTLNSRITFNNKQPQINLFNLFFRGQEIKSRPIVTQRDSGYHSIRRSFTTLREFMIKNVLSSK